MTEIPLSGKNGAGKFALIDDADCKLVSAHNWWLHKHGYAQTRVDGKNKSMHRFIMNATSEDPIDHKDLNRLNNQRGNLRLATTRDNLHNSAPRYGKKYKGVYLDKSGKPKCWVVKINFDGHQIYIGRYYTDVEAALAYDAVIRKYHGEFAWLNFPTE